MSVPSAEITDMLREHKARFAWVPSRALLASIRGYQQHCGSRNPLSLLLQK